ncbi:MAG TPA: corrinoid protein [Smithellaceae bacterium]|nr:corrinoid protein [Smithellaceae bacterium]HRS83818.1 corrinoid protein [Smithellaceae bacterium]HRV44399.1 corrinoid protein [Smithellaceae bacterium]
MSEDILKRLTQAVMDGNEKDAVRFCREAMERGLPARSVLENGLLPGIRKVGELFSAGEYYLPELLISGMAMQAAVAELEPLLNAGGAKTSVGKYLIGTVKGDIHDIGKNIVMMMLKGNGWEVTDLGVDVPPEEICRAIAEGDYDIFGMSALLTVTMPAADETVQAIVKAGLRDKIKIMIGGAPITREFAAKIGADGYAKDAFEAVNKALDLINRTQQ